MFYKILFVFIPLFLVIHSLQAMQTGQAYFTVGEYSQKAETAFTHMQTIEQAHTFCKNHHQKVYESWADTLLKNGAPPTKQWNIMVVIAWDHLEKRISQLQNK